MNVDLKTGQPRRSNLPKRDDQSASAFATCARSREVWGIRSAAPDLEKGETYRTVTHPVRLDVVAPLRAGCPSAKFAGISRRRPSCRVHRPGRPPRGLVRYGTLGQGGKLLLFPLICLDPVLDRFHRHAVRASTLGLSTVFIPNLAGRLDRRSSRRVRRAIGRRQAAPNQNVRTQVSAVRPHESAAFDTHLAENGVVLVYLVENRPGEQVPQVPLNDAAIREREFHTPVIEWPCRLNSNQPHPLSF